MNVLQQFAPAALNWLWQTSLAAAILAVVALPVQWTCGRAIGPRWTYALWLLIVVRLVMPLAPATGFSVFNLCASRPSAEIVQIDEPPMTPTTPALALPNVTVAQAPTPSSSLFTVPLLALLVWLTGAVVYLSFCLLHYRRFAAWARRQTPVSNGNVVEALRSARSLLSYPRDITVLATTTLRVPALFGFLRPRLLVPQAMLDTWSAEELRHALLHELVHARRRDHLLNWGLIVVQSVHWFNPIAHLALRRLRAERELLCDAIALSCMSTEQHRSYGAALVKAAQEFARARISPAIVPMINHNHEVKRRVSMIAQFKPTPRLISVAAVAALVLLACLTFTGKAQKPAPEAIQRQKTSTNAVEGASIKILESVYADMTKQLEARDKLLESMRSELGIPSYIAHGDGNQPGPDAENIRRLQSLRLEVRPDFRQLQSLLSSLNSLSGKEFGDAISIAMPDIQYASLQQRQAEVEQKLAAISEQFAADHPEVASLKRTLETIHRQLDDRRDGILSGLKTKVDSYKARVDEIEQELERAKRRDFDAATRYREYFNGKHELENYRRIRDGVQARIFEETINSVLARSADSRPETTPAKP